MATLSRMLNEPFMPEFADTAFGALANLEQARARSDEKGHIKTFGRW
jgi:hypothetical protein